MCVLCENFNESETNEWTGNVHTFISSFIFFYTIFALKPLVFLLSVLCRCGKIIWHSIFFEISQSREKYFIFLPYNNDSVGVAQVCIFNLSGFVISKGFIAHYKTATSDACCVTVCQQVKYQVIYIRNFIQYVSRYSMTYILF